MAVVSIDELEAGSVLKEDILGGKGQLLLPAGCAVTENHIRVFRTQGINLVNIESDDDSEEKEIDQETLKAAEERTRALFMHTDLTDPLMDSLFRIQTLEIASELASEDQNEE
ncbi:MAG: hypothetical protein GY854_29580 [Deltaproteobacteria bacterium]|nr:hypothetical protein [Deltaproteobacteria bacterium]